MTETEDGDGGFTLTEALVTLALAGMLVIFGLEASSWLIQVRRTILTNDETVVVDAATGFMKRELTMVQPLFLRGQNGSAVPVFQGGPHSITFAILADGKREPGGFHIVTYRLSEGGELVSERRLARLEAKAPASVRLMSGVKSLSFRYQYADRWVKRADLPLAVSFSLTFETSDRNRNATVILKFGGSHHLDGNILPDD